jgi:hypothetical protein
MEQLVKLSVSEFMKAQQEIMIKPDDVQVKKPETVLAEVMYEQFEAFCCAGFSNEQSFSLLLKTIDKVNNK